MHISNDFTLPPSVIPCPLGLQELQRKPVSWNMTGLQPQTEKRRNTSVDYPESMFQLGEVYCTALGADTGYCIDSSSYRSSAAFRRPAQRSAAWPTVGLLSGLLLMTGLKQKRRDRNSPYSLGIVPRKIVIILESRKPRPSLAVVSGRNQPAQRFMPVLVYSHPGVDRI